MAEYTGPRLTKAEADQAYEDSPITYLFGLGDGAIVIDGHSMAMFINHSCDANCETSEETTAASGSRPSATSPPAKRSPTITASTTAATTRPPATAGQKSAAGPCTRRKIKRRKAAAKKALEEDRTEEAEQHRKRQGSSDATALCSKVLSTACVQSSPPARNDTIPL